MNLEKLYSQILTDKGVPKEMISKKWELLDKNYSKKNRHYHNWIHILAMLKSWDLYIDKLENPVEVLLAIYYHDVIYVSTRKDNELKSAQLVISELQSFSEIDTSTIFDLILCTQNHQAKTNDQRWMVDFDLQILGRDWEFYEAYFKQIRREYRIYPNFMYKSGRKKALVHFLEKEVIYQTETFRTQYEKQARENIQTEISLL